MAAQPRVSTSDFPLLTSARALWTAGRHDDALTAYERAVASQPDNVRGLIEWARALGQQYRIAEAEARLERAEQLAAGDATVMSVVARSYRLIHRPERAIVTLERLRAMGSLPPPLIGELAVLYEQCNRLEEAEGAINECIERAAEQPEPKLVLARIRRARGDRQSAEALLEELTRREAAPDLLLARAWNELAYLRDESGDYAAAIEAVEKSKAIQRRDSRAERLVHRAEAINETFRRIYAEFDAPLMNDWRHGLPPDPRCSAVAHLLGFPRSGTTLLEQMLDAHPQLVGSSERLVFSRTIFPEMCRQEDQMRLTLDILRSLPHDRLCDLRRRYLDCMESLRGEPLAGRVHLDKNPNHTSLIVGLVRLFPESRFLVALRDPRDVVVSSYLQYFPLTEFSATLLTWEGVCRQYCFEMSIWCSVHEILAEQSLAVRYEDVVDDREAECRRALGLLGLSWDASISDYRNRIQTRLLHSPSQDAVRRPIHRRSIGRWKNYHRYVEPWLDQLAPFVKAFGYE